MLILKTVQGLRDWQGHQAKPLAHLRQLISEPLGRDNRQKPAISLRSLSPADPATNIPMSRRCCNPAPVPWPSKFICIFSVILFHMYQGSYLATLINYVHDVLPRLKTIFGASSRRCAKTRARFRWGLQARALSALHIFPYSHSSSRSARSVSISRGFPALCTNT